MLSSGRLPMLTRTAFAASITGAATGMSALRCINGGAIILMSYVTQRRRISQTEPGRPPSSPSGLANTSYDREAG